MASKTGRAKCRPRFDDDRKREAAFKLLYARSSSSMGSTRAAVEAIKAMGDLAALRAGVATADQLNRLINSSNRAVLLCEAGIGAEFKPLCHRAAKALAQVAAHYNKTSTVICPDDIEAVREMIGVLEGQRAADGYTEGMEYQTQAEVSKRLRNGEHFHVEGEEIPS